MYKRQKQLDTITATVFVEETLATDKNEDIYVSNSRLLSKDEVENIGIDNLQYSFRICWIIGNGEENTPPEHEEIKIGSSI